MKFLLSSSLSVFALLNLCNARSIVRRAENTDITQWLNKQIPFAKDRILAHINADGAIVAGSAPPVQEEGDPYQYFWVRDGGLTMMALADLWHQTGSSDIPPKFDAFHSWTLKTQDAARKSSPGWFTDKQAWTKYTLDGQPFKQWMSPQYDGPAVRALAFIKYGNFSGTSDKYYNRTNPNSVIKTDLDSIVSSWKSSDGYEPWEEVIGDHLFVRMVQYRALREGSELVRALGDGNGAALYESTAKEIKDTLGAFWDQSGGKLVSSLKGARNGGDNQGAREKVNQGYFVDVSSILGVNHGSDDDTLPATDPKVQATFYELINAFAKGAYKPTIVLSDWSLNTKETSFNGRPMNPAIGRYPEDIFDGLGYKYPGESDKVSSGAGFWFLATDAMSEMLYRSIIQYHKLGQITINADNAKFWKFIGIEGQKTLQKGSTEFNQALALLLEHGDRFLRRTQKYVSPDGYMSEQFHFADGHQMSTKDLCWSYASLVTAHLQRLTALKLVDGTVPVPTPTTTATPTAGPTATSAPEVCPIDDKFKIDCGYKGINQPQCESAGCCWKPAGENSVVPWCFKKVAKAA